MDCSQTQRQATRPLRAQLESGWFLWHCSGLHAGPVQNQDPQRNTMGGPLQRRASSPSFKKILTLYIFIYLFWDVVFLSVFTVKGISVDKVPSCCNVSSSCRWCDWNALCWTASVTTFSPVVTGAAVRPRSRKRSAYRLGQLAAGQRDPPPSG